ncbi:MAG: endonuclease III [Caldicoprobacterales bacterium]|nr:endonuclease III [Clostridiales bacterium]
MDKTQYHRNDIDYRSDKHAKIKEILRLLEEHYSDATTELNYKNPFELLIATILAAQCTDRQVNKVTPGLFGKYPGPAEMAALTPEELGKEIHSCGFYKTKSRNIIETCKLLLAKHGGQVPGDMESLISLPGVGRKTANVVLSNAFGKDAIAVDTHVFRVSNRLGLAAAADVLKTEQQLMENIPREKWSEAHHWLIYHGRRICKARKPDCENCFLQHLCRYRNEGQASRRPESEQ